jgi:polyisoprenoid-binding protein YceI
MKSITTIIVVIVAIVAIIFLTRGNNDNPLPEFEGPAGEVSLEDGAYAAEAGTQLSWQADKLLVPDHVDTGMVALSSADILVAEGAISGEVVIDMATISGNDTGLGNESEQLEQLAGHLKSADFFDVETYPTATFVITNTEKTDVDNEYLVTGDLTMKGITAPLSFPALVYTTEEGLAVQGNATIDRTMWDVQFGSGKFFEDLADNAIISDNFLVTMDFVAPMQ